MRVAMGATKPESIPARTPLLQIFCVRALQRLEHKGAHLGHEKMRTLRSRRGVALVPLHPSRLATLAPRPQAAAEADEEPPRSGRHRTYQEGAMSGSGAEARAMLQEEEGRRRRGAP